MLMLMFLAPRAGPVSDRACKYKYSWVICMCFRLWVLTMEGWLKTCLRDVLSGPVWLVSFSFVALVLVGYWLLLWQTGLFMNHGYLVWTHMETISSFAQSGLFSIVRDKVTTSTRLHFKYTCIADQAQWVTELVRAFATYNLLLWTGADNNNRLVKNNHPSAPQVAWSSGDTGMFFN